MTTVLVSVSSFDEKYVLRFAERLFSKIKNVFDMESSPDDSIDIVLGWKSIALLILSSAHSMKDGIGVMIGSGSYRVLC
ncbi:MAG: hypothetical protein SCH66_04030 [Methanolobus sp.]|nr:hypothetical protein [Methanolobus sp.]